MESTKGCSQLGLVSTAKHQEKKSETKGGVDVQHNWVCLTITTFLHAQKIPFCNAAKFHQFNYSGVQIPRPYGSL